VTLVATTYFFKAWKEVSNYIEDQPAVLHAGEAETSMMLVCEPDLVDLSNIEILASANGTQNFLAAG
tara:strand:+ start:122 stop:322 length:201 start_codon:yes stop_codon:yes gene_type:complete